MITYYSFKVGFLSHGCDFLMELEFTFADREKYFFGYKLGCFDLNDWLKTTVQPSEDQALFIMSQLILAVKFLHEVV